MCQQHDARCVGPAGFQACMSSCQQTFVGMGRSPNNTKPLRTPPGSPTNAASPIVHLPPPPPTSLTGAHPGQNTRRRPARAWLGHAGTAPRPSIYAPGLVQLQPVSLPRRATCFCYLISPHFIEKSASQPGEAVESCAPVRSSSHHSLRPPASRSTVPLLTTLIRPIHRVRVHWRHPRSTGGQAKPVVPA